MAASEGKDGIGCSWPEPDRQRRAVSPTAISSTAAAVCGWRDGKASGSRNRYSATQFDCVAVAASLRSSQPLGAGVARHVVGESGMPLAARWQRLVACDDPGDRGGGLLRTGAGARDGREEVQATARRSGTIRMPGMAASVAVPMPRSGPLRRCDKGRFGSPGGRRCAPRQMRRASGTGEGALPDCCHLGPEPRDSRSEGRSWGRIRKSHRRAVRFNGSGLIR